MFKKETDVTPNEYRQRGGRVQGDPKVQGYLSFNRWEAEALLKKYFYNAN
jgi:AraC-like DNA-binding protein